MTVLAPPPALERVLPPTIEVGPAVVVPEREAVCRRRRRRPTLASRMRNHALGVAIAAATCVAGAVIAFLWFRTGAFYARGDVGPWIRDGLGSELGWHWTHQNSGAGGPTYEVVRAPELLSIRLARLLGGTEAFAQRLFFTASFAYAAAGVAMFVARFTRRPVLVFTAGLLGAFNPLVMVNLPNYLLPLAIGLVGTTGAIAVTAARGRATRRHPRLIAVLSLTCASLALNPPLLAIVGGWIALLPVTIPALTRTGRRGFGHVAALLGRGAAWAAPLALWWVVPYVFALGRAAASGTIGADTDVASWSWTHAHGSLDRVLTLVAKWSWPDTRFGHNAPFMGGAGWRALTFALPAGAFLAAAVARPRHLRAARVLLVALVPLALVAKGLRPPLRGVNAWLYEHVPGSWLLREPMNKVGVLLVLVLVTGWVLALDGAFARLRVARRRGRGRGLRLAHAALVLLALAPLVFAWPMLTGTAVRGDDRVRVPGAWHEVANAVDESPVRGKALVLPLDDFYQVPTTWGFYGTDTMVRQLLARPVIARNPENYVGDTDEFDALARATEQALNAGDSSAAARLLRSLGVSHVIVRRDIDFDSEIRAPRMSRPETLLTGMGAVPGFEASLRTEVADVFELDGGADAVEAFGGTIVVDTVESDALAALVASLPPDLVVATEESPASRGRGLYFDGEMPARNAPSSPGDWRYARRAEGMTLVNLRSRDSGLVIEDATRIGIDGRSIAGRRPLTVAAAGPATAVEVDGELLDLGGGERRARVGAGTVIRPYASSGGSVLGSWGELGDCNRYDARTPQETGISAEVGTAGTGRVTKLRAGAHAACIAAPIGPVVGGDVLRVSVDVRAVEGAPPRVCLWHDGPDRCASMPATQALDDDWHRLSAVHRVPDATTGVRLYLYADEPARDGIATQTEVWYRDARADTLVAGTPVTMRPRPSPTGTVSLGADPVDVHVDVDVPVPTLGPRSQVGDCHRYDDRSLDEAGIDARELRTGGNGVHLSARSHSACVSMPVLEVQPATTYELSFDATVHDGAAPRTCLWEEPAGRCVDLEAVSSPERDMSGTYRFRGRVGSSTTGAHLYLYADTHEGAADIEYRDVALRPVTSESLVLLPRDLVAGPAPRIRWEQDNPARYRVHVDGADAPFVLALTDAWSRDWRVRGLPDGAEIRSLKVDGYRSGWVIDAPGDHELVVEYAPARQAQIALRVSQATAVSLALAPLTAPIPGLLPRRKSRRARALARARRRRRKRGYRPLTYRTASAPELVRGPELPDHLQGTHPDDWILPSR